MDRSIVFVKPDTTAAERRTLRGVLLEASDLSEAKRRFKQLEAAAEEAIYSNEVPAFFDELDCRQKTIIQLSPTFAEFAGDWLKTCVEDGGLRESEVESTKGIVTRHLLKVFGQRRLSEIDARQIDRYKATKRRQKHQYGVGYSAATISNHLSILRRIFKKAVDYGVLEFNPVRAKAWLPRETTPEEGRDWWTDTEEAKAFVVLDDWKTTRPGDRLTIMTQLITGVRFSELRAFEKSDLDLSTPGLWVKRSIARKQVGTPKNKLARFQVIPRELAEELRVWMLKTEGQLLFPDPRGIHLSNKVLNRWYRELAKEAGVKVITSHGARHKRPASSLPSESEKKPNNFLTAKM